MGRHGMRLLLNTIKGPVRKSINVNNGCPQGSHTAVWFYIVRICLA